MNRDGRTRVLYVQRPSGGGSATGLVDLLRTLDPNRYEPVVLCYRANRYCDAYEEAGARVLVLDGRTTARPLPGNLGEVAGGLRRIRTLKQLSRLIRRDLPLARRIAAVIRRERVDLVHHNDNPRGDRASIIAARMAGVPQICHVRYLAEYFRPLDRTLSRFVDFFIYMSIAIEHEYRTAVGVPDEKGRVVYDPFDFATLSNGDRRAVTEVRRELGLDDEDLVIANVGRLVPWKGQDLFLEAMARLAPSFPRLRVLLVGKGRDGEKGEDYLRRLRERAAGSELDGHVIFTGFRKDVPAILAASDVVVHSSQKPEPFGRIVVEALAAGRPVVATAAGGVPEIIDDGRTGLLVPLGDADRMADAVATFLEDPDAARQLAARGRAAVRERFAPDRFGQALDRIYTATLSSYRAG